MDHMGFMEHASNGSSDKGTDLPKGGLEKLRVAWSNLEWFIATLITWSNLEQHGATCCAMKLDVAPSIEYIVPWGYSLRLSCWC